MPIQLQDFTKRFDNTTVIERMNLEVHDGEMLALLGPSGCGKSTTLLAISGIHRVNGGQILFGEEDVSEQPSQKRNVGVVFQNYALYPHMTAYQNIAFPLEVRGMGREQIDKEVRAIAALVHIEQYLERRPGQLSGGQQQRVALARALVRKPGVLLLDEPLANLDAKLRLEMRSEIRRIQQETGITAILVTHDQVEAMSMCDRIAIMNEGQIIQIDTPTEMYRNPKTQFVAGFLGNPPIAFVNGRASGEAIRLDADEVTLPLPTGARRPKDGEPIVVGIRPEIFGVNGGSPIGGRVSFVETQGRENLYDVALPSGAVLRSIQPVRHDISVGDQVTWGVNPDALMVFSQDGTRL
ncbi:sugar ABC transporter ATP-binding protein [Devosia pacifica]|uniref:Sugar ABC transporter ATP-binding protein n=1 Tax=Devosia pacifica TaxID=1335967 RepID=A0A918VSX8_9HYPH|nr:ABC transporter ATP-binding protein [Devosia pacifica]GHA21431.1 sugar ABC transporter ATP-binding protein [Devosia pacifica]